MAIARGYRDNADVLSQRKVVDMSNKIHLLEDSEDSLTKLLSRLPKKPAYNTTVQWMTDELVPKSTTLAEDIDGSETGVDVASGTGVYFQINDIVKVPITGETMLVTGVSTDTLTVTRSWGATSASAAAVSGDEIVNLGPAFNEGAHLRTSDSDDTPLARTVQETQNVDYTQIFRHAVGLTRSETQIKMYGGADRAYQRRKKMLEHVRDMNLSLHHGEKQESTLRRSLGGILEFVSTNSFATSTLTESQFNTDLRSLFRYGNGSQRLFLCSRAIAGYISEWAQQVQRVEPGESKFGVAITKYQSPHGVVNIVTDHALEGTTWNKYAEGIDTSCIALRPLQDTILRVDVQDKDVDGVLDEYLTETAFEKGNEKFHGKWTAVAG